MGYLVGNIAAVSTLWCVLKSENERRDRGERDDRLKNADGDVFLGDDDPRWRTRPSYTCYTVGILGISDRVITLPDLPTCPTSAATASDHLRWPCSSGRLPPPPLSRSSPLPRQTTPRPRPSHLPPRKVPVLASRRVTLPRSDMPAARSASKAM